MKKVTAALILFLIFVSFTLVLMWYWAKPSPPSSFYDAPSGMAIKHGVLLRHEPLTENIPDDAQAWKILYTTTQPDGSQVVASGVVVIPKNMPDGPRPVIAYAHGTVGVVPGCAPSLLDEPYPSGSATALLDIALENGWIFVGTDYVGLGTQGPNPFLIGEGEARSVLDSVLAIKQMPDLAVDTQTIIWGHSQGGHAALWSGILAKKYAPNINILGVAAISPATDLIALMDRVKDQPIGRFFSSYLARAYSQSYEDLAYDDIVKPGIRWLTRDIASRCMVGNEALVSLAEAYFIPGSILSNDQPTPSLSQHLADNVPDELVPFPLLIGQGAADNLVFADIQSKFVQSRCDAGQVIDYRLYQGKGHLDVIAETSPLIPDLTQWTIDRLEDTPAATTCSTSQR